MIGVRRLSDAVTRYQSINHHYLLDPTTLNARLSSSLVITSLACLILHKVQRLCHCHAIPPPILITRLIYPSTDHHSFLLFCPSFLSFFSFLPSFPPLLSSPPFLLSFPSFLPSFPPLSSSIHPFIQHLRTIAKLSPLPPSLPLRGPDSARTFVFLFFFRADFVRGWGWGWRGF